jgi:hypothetical protein
MGTTEVTVKLRPDLPYTYLSSDLYETFVAGKNIYNESTWTEQLTVEIGDDLDASAKTCSAPFAIRLRYADLVYTADSGTKTLLLKSYNSTSPVVILGASVWKAAAFHRRASENDLTIRQHRMTGYLDWFSCFVLLVLLILTMRWMLSDVAKIATESSAWHSQVLDYVYEFVAIPFALYAIANAGTRAALEDYPVLRVASFVFTAIALFAEVVSVTLAYVLPEKERRRASVGYYILMSRSFAHVVLLLHATWCILLIRRFEGVDTTLTFFVNTVAVLVFAFYAFVALGFHLSELFYGFGQVGTSVMGCVALPLLGAVAYQGFAWWTYFAIPTFRRNARFYERILLPCMILGLCLLLLFASYLARKAFRKAALSMIVQKYKKLPAATPAPTVRGAFAMAFGPSTDKRK